MDRGIADIITRVQGVAIDDAPGDSINYSARLPAEILAYIFERSADMEIHTSGSSGIKPDGDLVACTHVCQEWRETALGTSTLWAYIRLDSRPGAKQSDDWVTELLRRSKDATLFVSIQAYHSNPYQLNLLIEHHHERIRVFEIKALGNERTIITSLNRLLSAPAPSLKSFSCEWNVKLPQDLFAGIHPQLQHLSLTTMAAFTKTITWTSSVFAARLTSLTIVRLQQWAGWRGGDEVPIPSLSEVGSVLSQLRSLRRLHITGDVISILPETVDAGSINLPCLSQLILHGKSQMCINLLQHLVFPADCEYDYTFNIPRRSGFDASHATEIFDLLRLRHTLTSPSLTHQDSELALHADNNLFRVQRVIDGHVCAGVCFANFKEVSQDLFGQISPALALVLLAPGRITTLKVSLGTSLDEEDRPYDRYRHIRRDQWMELLSFENVQHVRRLHIISTSGDLFGLLSSTIPGNDSKEAKTLLPGLDHIAFERTDFLHRPWIAIGSSIYRGPSQFNVLSSFLQDRQRIGLAVKSLNITESRNITTEHTLLLSSMVSQVIVLG